MSVVPLFFGPKVNSQQFTTVTSFQTSTITSTEARNSTVTNWTEFGVPMPTNGVDKRDPCSYAALQILNITAGSTMRTVVYLSPWLIQRSLSFDLYLLSSQSFNEYQSRSDQNHELMCDPLSIPSISPFFQGKNQLAYAFNFTNSTGETEFRLLIVNTNRYDSIDVVVSVDVIVPYSVTKSQTLTYTRLENSEIPFATPSSVYSSTVQTSPWSGVPTSYLESLVVIVVLGAIAVSLCWGLISGRRARKSTEKEGIIKAKTEKGVQFCINCGSELQPESKFCHKCGSAQT
jgi:hypothetical protein